MNKTILVGIGILFIAGLLVLAFWIAGSKTTSETSSIEKQNSELPVAQSWGQGTTTSTADSTGQTTLSIVATNGQPVQTRDFLSDPMTVKDPINPGYYYLGYHMYEGVPDATATDNPPYVIEYISMTYYFNVALLQEPIGTTRAEAEKYLIERLGISQDQMCQLNYMVSVSARINSRYTSRNLGFSFCPGATVLPQ